MRNIMVDLETLGTRPGCVILSIGAVVFRHSGADGILGREFYCVVNMRSCQDAGLTIDPETVAWWDKQDAAARQVIAEAETGGLNLPDALNQFSEFILGETFPTTPFTLWGNGADFDNAILAEAYRRCGLRRAPWQPVGSRCYRTLKNLAPTVLPERQGVFHNALDDAKTQAKHAARILSVLRVG